MPTEASGQERISGKTVRPRASARAKGPAARTRRRTDDARGSGSIHRTGRCGGDDGTRAGAARGAPPHSPPRRWRCCATSLRVALDCLRDHVAGNCPQIPYSTISLLAAGVCYFADELDLVPDFLSRIGRLDDGAVMAMAFQLGADGIRRYCTATGRDADAVLGRCRWPPPAGAVGSGTRCRTTDASFRLVACGLPARAVCRPGPSPVSGRLERRWHGDHRRDHHHGERRAATDARCSAPSPAVQEISMVTGW